MAIFSDLSNDLIMCIWDFVVDPDDIPSFALTSPRIYSLSARYLREDKFLREQYSAISFNDCAWSPRPREVLGEMLLNPRIALYIHEIDIERWDGDAPGEAEPRASSKIAKEDLERAILASRLVPSSEVDEWIKDAIQGHEDRILAIIVMQLTRIRELRLFDERQNDYSLKTLKLIAQNLDGDSLDASPKPSVFSNLSKMGIVSPHVVSNMICRMLPSSTALTSFIYDNEGTETFDGDCNELDICDQLLGCSQHSLERLVLYQDDLSCMGYITGFKGLKKLETYFDTLLIGPNEHFAHLSDMLPASIEHVALLLSMYTPAKILRKVILEVIKSKKDGLPNLKSLTIGVADLYDVEYEHYRVFEQLQEPFKKIGAELKWSNKLRSHF